MPSIPDSDDGSSPDRRRLCGFDLAEILKLSLVRRTASARDARGHNLSKVDDQAMA